MSDKAFWEGQSETYKASVAARCREALDLCLEPLREIAKAHGYAIGVHGSVARDIDLMAIPWSAEAAGPADLMQAVFAEIYERCGFATWGAGQNPEHRPHGRLAYAIVIGGGAYFDISIMPPVS